MKSYSSNKMAFSLPIFAKYYYYYLIFIFCFLIREFLIDSQIKLSVAVSCDVYSTNSQFCFQPIIGVILIFFNVCLIALLIYLANNCSASIFQFLEPEQNFHCALQLPNLNYTVRHVPLILRLENGQMMIHNKILTQRQYDNSEVLLLYKKKQ